MIPKYLRPYRERLHWISIFLGALCIISLIIIIGTHQYYPAYRFEYIIRQKTFIWFYLLVLATLTSVGINLYYGWLGRHISKTGTFQSGRITKVYWHRSFLSGSEWKCRLVINCNNGEEYVSPYYRYDLLNYLYDTRCELYVLGKSCYVTGFQTIDRMMTKEEKKAGTRGGPWPFNTTPNFPFLSLVEQEARYKKNSTSRPSTMRFFLRLTCFILTLYTTQFSMEVYTPSRGDSDYDGAPDYMEFELGTDPLTVDSLFPITDTDESTRSNATLNAKAPYYKYMIGETYIDYIIPALPFDESVSGYVDQPFTFQLPKGCTEAFLVVEFDESLLTKKDFVPKLYKFSHKHQDVGMIELPSQWDGSSNFITWDCTEESNAPQEGWDYYLMDKTRRDEWLENYWGN